MSGQKSKVLQIYEQLPLDKVYQILLKTPTQIPMNGKAALEYLTLEGGKNLYILYEECYSSKALKLMHERIKPHIEKNPDDWLFLLEGGLVENIPESVYANVLGKKLKIPIENPIKDPYDKEVIEKVIEEGANPEDIYSILCIEMLKAIPDFDKVVDNLSKMWNISPYYLRGLIIYLGMEVKENPDYLSEYLNKNKKNWEKIIQTSNDLSLQKLKEILKKYSDKNNIFAYVGKKHKEIFNKIRY